MNSESNVKLLSTKLYSWVFGLGQSHLDGVKASEVEWFRSGICEMKPNLFSLLYCFSKPGGQRKVFGNFPAGWGILKICMQWDEWTTWASNKNHWSSSSSHLQEASKGPDFITVKINITWTLLGRILNVMSLSVNQACESFGICFPQTKLANRYLLGH